jgi:formylglycine-generating enzyme required for sulfatase activity
MMRLFSGRPLDGRGQGTAYRGFTRITIAKGFWIGKYEVTRAQFAEFQRTLGGETYVSKLDHPAEMNWKQAVSYCKWLSSKTRSDYRLPSNAEWGYASRYPYVGVDDKPCYMFPWGPAFPKKGHRVGNISIGRDWGDVAGLAPVGSFQPTSIGLFDMAGNVEEWCSEPYQYSASETKRYSDGYVDQADINRPELLKADHYSNSRVTRGGGTHSSPNYYRCDNPTFESADESRGMGLRLVRTAVSGDPQAHLSQK